MAIVTVETKPFTSNPARTSRKALWTGNTLSGLAVAFMAMDGMMKVLKMPMAVEGMVKLGFPAGVVFWLGLIQLVMLALYLIPLPIPS